MPGAPPETTTTTPPTLRRSTVSSRRPDAADRRRRVDAAADRPEPAADVDHRRRARPRRRSTLDRTTATPASCAGRGADQLPQVDLLDDSPVFGRIVEGDIVLTAGGTESLAPPDIPVGIVRNVVSRSVRRGTAAGDRAARQPRPSALRDGRAVQARGRGHVADRHPGGAGAADARIDRAGSAAAAVLRRPRRARPPADALRRSAPWRRVDPGHARPRRRGGRGRRTAEGRPRRLRARPDVRPAVGTPLGSSSLAMGIGGFVAGYVESITIEPHWWLAALFTGLGAAVGEAMVPVVRTFVGEEQVFEPRLGIVIVGRRGGRHGAQPAARPGRAMVHAHQASGVESSRRKHDARLDAHRQAHCAMALISAPRAWASSPSSPRCCSAPIGARLWFLQTVQAESLQQTVDARKTKTVRLLPERGRIVDIDGRILADNERVLTVSVDWDVMQQRHRPGRAVHPAVGLARAARRRDGGALRLRALQPVQADADQGERQGVRRHRHQRAHRGLPGRLDRRGLAAGLPLRAARRHVLGYMGAITAEDQTHYDDLGYDTSLGGERVGRSGVELGMEDALHGKWGEVVYEVDANNRIVREISYEAPVNGMDVQLSIDLDSSSTPSACCRPSCACAASSRSPTRRSSASSRTAPCAGPDGPEPRRRHPGRLQGAGRLGDGHGPAQRAGRGHGQLPDVRQPLVRSRRRRREVQRAVPGRRHRPRRRGADQPGDPGPVQRRVGVQAVRGLRRTGHRAGSARAAPTTTRASTSCSRSRTMSAPQASAASSATRSARTSTARASTAR